MSVHAFTLEWLSLPKPWTPAHMLAITSQSITGWFTLAGTAVGIGIGGAFALTNAVINRRWSRRDAADELNRQASKFLHANRREIYSAYVLNIAKIYQILQDVNESPSGRAIKSPQFRELSAEGERIRSELILLASTQVLDTENSYREAQQDLIKSVYGGNGFISILAEYKALLDSMREDIQSLIPVDENSTAP